MSGLGQYHQFHDPAASPIFTSLTFLAALQESKIFKAHFVAYLVLGGVALSSNVCSSSALQALRNRLINDTSQMFKFPFENSV
jgi:hypothetical protein